MNNSNDAPSRSDTVNGYKYRNGADTVRVATVNGLPIAFRSVRVATAGSFATTRAQAVTAAGITSLSASRAASLIEEATAPLN